MKGLLLFLAVAACLVGCNSGPDTVATAPPLNPSGKPRNEKEQALADAYKQAGDKMNQERAAAAQAMAAAQAKTGGR
jgi:hypothetical protein